MTPSLPQLIAKGESATLEPKRSTGELREALQTLCAFANAKGGRVLIGVKPNGELVGQQVSEQTFHEIAAARDRFEPPIEFEVEAMEVAPGRSALVLTVAGARDSVPFTFDGRAFERVGNTTRKMAQEVTFRVPVAGAESRAESRAESLHGRILEGLRPEEQSKSGLATKLGLSSVTGQLNRAVAALVDQGLVELTIPDKPNSRLQKYRLTATGRAAVAKEAPSRWMPRPIEAERPGAPAISQMGMARPTRLGAESMTQPAQALRHYEVGMSIGAFSLGRTFRNVLPWGLIDNRPFLRCMHGVGLCGWRLGKTCEAAAVFHKMLWLNPGDNQGACFNLAAIEAGKTGEELEGTET